MFATLVPPGKVEEAGMGAASFEQVAGSVNVAVWVKNKPADGDPWASRGAV